VNALEDKAMKLSDVLDGIKEKNGLKTNTALAEFLGIDFRRIPEYYKGREPMDDDYPKIAMASGKRVDELQYLVKITTSKDEKTREVWSKYYKSIGGIAASVFMTFAFLATLIVADDAKASENQSVKNANCLEYKLCAYW
jgi:hypothetical protein